MATPQGWGGRCFHGTYAAILSQAFALRSEIYAQCPARRGRIVGYAGEPVAAQEVGTGNALGESLPDEGFPEPDLQGHRGGRQNGGMAGPAR